MANCVPDPGRDPYDSNQAIPTVLFKRAPQWLTASGMPLCILDVRWLSLFVLPSYRRFQVLVADAGQLGSAALRVEESLLPLLGSLIGFRLFIVLERE